jgi:hypothetical protein
MIFIAALLAFILSVALGALLIANLIQVLGWGIFTMALVPLLPFGLDLVAQLALAIPGLVGSALALTIVVLAILLVVFLLYWWASAAITIPAAPVGLIATGLAEGIPRAGLVGFNAGLNLTALLGLLALAPGGPLVSLVLTLINFAAFAPAIANNAVYQVILGYTTLFLPMALVMNLAGLVTLALNTAAAAVGTPLSVFAEWTRANLVMHGGVVHGCKRTAFNMANFTLAHPDMALDDPWADPGTPIWPFCPAPPGVVVRAITVRGAVFHEASHTLNVGAFGWIYHLVGFADQQLPMPWSGGTARGSDAHSELCAESGLRDLEKNWIAMWAPAAAAGNGNAVASATAADAPGVVVVTPTTIAIPVTGEILPALRVVCERNRGVSLDSSPSVDADAFPMPLGRLWFAGFAPPDSTLSTGPISNAVQITYTPDAGLRHRVELWVTDGVNGSPVAGVRDFSLDVIIEVLHARIAAVPPIVPGVPVQLDGTSSFIPTADVAAGPRFEWQLLAVPPGSGLALGAFGTNDNATFTPDVPAAGAPYLVQFRVSIDVTPVSGGAPVTLSDTATVPVS